MELDYERATESSDDGDSKQFMILLLAVLHYQDYPEEMAANAFRDVNSDGANGLLVSIMKLEWLYTFVQH